MNEVVYSIPLGKDQVTATDMRFWKLTDKRFPENEYAIVLDVTTQNHKLQVVGLLTKEAARKIATEILAAVGANA